MNRLPVWLDCDAGVDDAIALMRSPNIWVSTLT